MFETARLLLRGLDVDTDLDAVWRSENDALFTPLIRPHPTVPYTREQVKDFFKPREMHELPIFAICEKTLEGSENTESQTSPPKIIGILNFQSHYLDYKNRTAALGIGIFSPANRGKGYGREVVEWSLRYCFNELGLHRVELDVNSFNLNAIGLYRKCGFVDEGVRRKSCLKGGVWHDTLIMAILEEEWYQRQTQQSSATALPDSRANQ